MNFKTVKLIAFTLLTYGMMSHVNAAARGIYFGAQLGRTNQHNLPLNLQVLAPGYSSVTTESSLTTNLYNPSNTGIGGRISFGYNYSDYFGIEMGFTHYGPTTYTITSSPQLAVGSPSGTTRSPAINENGFDFVAKGMLPVGSTGLGALGKAGVAIIKRGQAGSLSQSFVFNPNPTLVNSQTANTTNFRPTAALGFYYDFTQSLEMDFTISRVFGGGNMKNADLYAIGLSYHFVDVYCGQFLC